MIVEILTALIALGAGIGLAVSRYSPRIASLVADKGALEVSIATLTAEKGALEIRLADKESAQVDQVEAMRNMAHQAVASAREELNQDALAQKSAVGNLLDPVKEELEKLRKFVDEKNTAVGQEYSSLKTVTEALQLSTTSLNTTLSSNRHAGSWGELTLHNIVDYAGMLEHVDFEEQESISDDDSLKRPDMVIKLAGGGQIAVDSKASLVAYRRAAEESDQALKERHLVDHAKAVKAHITRLSSKKYSEMLGQSPDYVVMFVPGEHFVTDALATDSELLDYAYRNKVVLATPSTLLVVLKSAAYTWREVDQAENAKKIGAAGAELYKRLVVSFEHLTRAGKNLNAAVENFNKFGSSVTARVRPQAMNLKRYAGALDDLDYPAQIDGVVAPLAIGEVIDDVDYIDVEEEA
ncbi:DNA recombination protein RmuC [mine drainage metagenome]|uniref:DNA recombination protein RmuC n=1 Tax=mine drainage metagenome TaxID=410659 RepID=A0A1J5PVM8_9ZZZZ